MGNHMSRRTTAGKVILSNGTIRLLDQPTSVAELMLDYPQELVVELELRRAAPLPADHELDPAKVYLMIPMQNAKNASSLAAKAMAKEKARSAHLAKKAGKKPLMMMGCANIDTSDWQMVISHNSAAAAAVDVVKKKGVGLVGEERPEFLGRQLSSRRWKPNLEPIEEKAAQNKFHFRWCFRN